MKDKRWLLCADSVVVQGSFGVHALKTAILKILKAKQFETSSSPDSKLLPSLSRPHVECFRFETSFCGTTRFISRGSVMSYACSDKKDSTNECTLKNHFQTRLEIECHRWSYFIFSFSLSTRLRVIHLKVSYESRHQAAVSSSNSNDNKISGINVYNFNSRFLCTDFNCHALPHFNVDWFVLPRTMKRQNFVCKVSKQIRSNRARFAQSHMQMLMEIVFLMFLHFVEVLSESQIA